MEPPLSAHLGALGLAPTPRCPPAPSTAPALHPRAPAPAGPGLPHEPLPPCVLPLSRACVAAPAPASARPGKWPRPSGCSCADHQTAQGQLAACLGPLPAASSWPHCLSLPTSPPRTSGHAMPGGAGLRWPRVTGQGGQGQCLRWGMWLELSEQEEVSGRQLGRVHSWWPGGWAQAHLRALAHATPSAWNTPPLVSPWPSGLSPASRRGLPALPLSPIPQSSCRHAPRTLNLPFHPCCLTHNRAKPVRAATPSLPPKPGSLALWIFIGGAAAQGASAQGHSAAGGGRRPHPQGQARERETPPRYAEMSPSLPKT